MARAVIHAAIELDTAKRVQEVATSRCTSESRIVQEALDRYLAYLVAVPKEQRKQRERA